MNSINVENIMLTEEIIERISFLQEYKAESYLELIERIMDDLVDDQPIEMSDRDKLLAIGNIRGIARTLRIIANPPKQ